MLARLRSAGYHASGDACSRQSIEKTLTFDGGRLRDVEYLVAERIRPCRNRPFTSHETVDRRAIRLPPATKGRAAAASPDPQAAAPNAGHCQCWRVLRRWRSGRTRALRLEHRQPRVIW